MTDEVFSRRAGEYDRWYDRHAAAYRSELAAVRRALPRTGRGLEVGVGTGRFAAPLGIAEGIDPAGNMLALARRRGVKVRRGRGEALPYGDGEFDYVAIIVTLCFVADPPAVLREARRVLKPGGTLVAAVIDRESELGRRARVKQSPFYHGARFFSVPELRGLLKEAGFTDMTAWQTLTGPPDAAAEPEPPRRGTGRGGFVVLRARARAR